MNEKILEHAAQHVGISGFCEMAIEQAKNGKVDSLVSTASALLIGAKPKFYEMNINSDDSNSVNVWFISEATKETHSFTLPLCEGIAERIDEVVALFSALSLEFAFKQTGVTHAKRVQ
ncbi:hypothetical protein ABMY35_01165 [Pseudoalteromonas sp. BZB3]|uniref:hypothetical protein n=1 Tax=Pseudoalteromonas sp. BZB3 TaxID=3136670 RepID=UPI0032C3EE8E